MSDWLHTAQPYTPWIVTGVLVAIALAAIFWNELKVAPSSRDRARAFDARGSRFEAGGVSQTYDSTTVPGWLLWEDSRGWHASKSGGEHSGPWSTWSQAVSAARHIDQRRADYEQWEILLTPQEAAAIKEKELRMGTGVKGSDNYMTAAAVMRIDAERFRRDADVWNKRVAESEAERAKFAGIRDHYRAEADKLDQAAKLIDGGGMPNVERDVGAEGIKSYAEAERKAPRYDKAVHSVEITARSFAGDAVRSAVITEEEIEDGFLGVLTGSWDQSPQAQIWRRLRKVAGLE